jgi:hypothetical protein
MNTDIDSWRRPLFDDVIRRIRVRSGEYYRPEFQAPWGVSVSRNCSLFHVVRQGNCQLEIPGMREPILLSEGDCAIVVRGEYHVVRAGPRSASSISSTSSRLTNPEQPGRFVSEAVELLQACFAEERRSRRV